MAESAVSFLLFVIVTASTMALLPSNSGGWTAFLWRLKLHIIIVFVWAPEHLLLWLMYSSCLSYYWISWVILIVDNLIHVNLWFWDLNLFGSFMHQLILLPFIEYRLIAKFFVKIGSLISRIHKASTLAITYIISSSSLYLFDL